LIQLTGGILTSHCASIHARAAEPLACFRRAKSIPAMPLSSAENKRCALAGTLRGCQLFSELATEDLIAVAAFTVLKNLTRGKYLFHQGAPSEGFYLVQRGAINVHRVSPAGKEQVIHVFRAGESFAEASLASPTGYPADARAVESSTVLLIPKAPALALIGRRPDLALRMLGSMSVHLWVLVGMLDDLTLKDVETRLLNWLVKRQRTAANGVISLSGTKRVLAAELGTSSETLSRTLGRLRKQKFITVGARTITVVDTAALLAHLRRNLGES
jgi:CRP-like cAMP-binding protein